MTSGGGGGGWRNEASFDAEGGERRRGGWGECIIGSDEAMDFFGTSDSSSLK